jgi:ferredoxin-nitrite reductase
MEDAKIRLYWSACIKGCGVHGAGDLGFVGCKVPRDGKTVLGVDIFIGGSLSGEGEESKLFLKGIVLSEAPQYVAELMRLYRDLRFTSESLEQFIKRLRLQYEINEIADIVRHNTTTTFEGMNNFYTFDRISR